MKVIEVFKGDENELNKYTLMQSCQIIGITANESLINTFVTQARDPLDGNGNGYKFSNYFYYLYRELPNSYDYLVRDRVVDSDWKWDPKEIIQQVNNLLYDVELTLVSDDYREVVDSFQVKLSINGDVVELEVLPENPHQLLDEINKHLTEQEFISINVNNDSFFWKLVKRDANLELFSQLTGYSLLNYIDYSESIEGAVFASNLTSEELSKKLGLSNEPPNVTSQKIYFIPKIIVKHNNEWCRLELVDKNSNQEVTWAGQVKSDQSFNEGVVQELRQDFNYDSFFDYGDVEEAGGLDDVFDHETPHYKVTILLHQPLLIDAVMGAEIRYIKI